MIPDWCEPYIGIPFVEKGKTHEGCDCWGLIVLIYREQLKIELPSFHDEYKTVHSADDITRICRREQKLWTEVIDPKTFDSVLLRIKGYPWHVGMVLDDQYMIHCDPKIGSVIERYTASLWKHRIEGFYRHASRS